MTNTIKLPQLAWYEPKELELPLPDSWQVEVCNMAGYNRPAMTNNQIKASVTNLIGTPPIRELARGKKEVVIIFDDMTRGTKVARIVPFVLEELAEAGIPDSKIRFIAATGTHQAMKRTDFVKKLGEATLSRFRVYNHNPFDNCTYVGTTSYGTKVFVNEEVMKCDFKITIGSVTSHVFAIFSGGGKMILPGVCSIETIMANHSLPLTEQELHDYDTNHRRLDMEEAAKLVGLDVAIECILNLWGDTVAIFAGAEIPAHAASVQNAATHYLTTRAEDKDIVIANNFIKAGEATTTLKAADSVRQSGGDLVVIANAPQGQIFHYLLERWKERFPIPPHLSHLILFTEYPDIVGAEYFEDSPKLLLMSTWDDVLRALQEFHGDSATVAVYPNADILYFG